MNTPPDFTFTDEEIQAFAREMLADPARPAMKSAQAALGVDPKLVGKCLYAISELVKDERYLNAVEKEKEKPKKPNVPTKDETLKTLWDLASFGLQSDRIKAAELFCKVAGYLETAGRGTTVTVNPAVHVMEVPVSSSDDEWEAKLKANQDALMNHGTTIN